jgi:hypothetical protein
MALLAEKKEANSIKLLHRQTCHELARQTLSSFPIVDAALLF